MCLKELHLDSATLDIYLYDAIQASRGISVESTVDRSEHPSEDFLRGGTMDECFACAHPRERENNRFSSIHFT
jgi:hypothetical protein